MAWNIEYREPVTGRTVFSGLSTDTEQNAPAGSVVFLTDSKVTLEYNGVDWQQTKSGGAAHVAGAAASGTLATSESIGTGADIALATDLDVAGLSRVMVHIAVAANDLDQFEIHGSVDGTVFETLFSSAGDYTSPTGIMIGTSGDLTGITATNTGWYLMDVSGINSLRHILSAAGGAATVTVTYSGD